jgi:hypothetical protein
MGRISGRDHERRYDGPVTDTKRERDLDEGVAIQLDPETALRGLLKVNPDAEPTAKERALEALRQAYPEDLKLVGDKLRGDARRAEASWEEIEEAENTHPRYRPPRPE